MDAGSAHAVDGGGGVGVLTAAVQNALHQIQLAGEEIRIHAVGLHLQPVLGAGEFANNGLEIFIHDLEHVGASLFKKLGMCFNSSFAAGNLFGEMEREQGRHMVYRLAVDSRKNPFAFRHVC